MTAIIQNQPVELRLHSHQVVHLSQVKADTAIECTTGILWITCSSDQTKEYSRDILLAAGERYQPAGKGQVVIEAMSESGLILAQERKNHSLRLTHSLAG